MPNTHTPIHICHVVLSLEVGGMENGLVNVSNRLPRDRFKTTVLCIRRIGPMAERLAEDVNLHCLDCPSGFRLGKVLEMRRWLGQHDFDILYTHNGAALMWGAAAMLGHRRPWFVHGEHGNCVSRGTLGRLAARRPKVYTAVSANLAGPLQAAYKLPGADVRVLENGVDATRFQSGGGTGALRAEFGIPDDAVLFGIVGRLEPRKNQHVAVRALGEVSARLAAGARPHLILFGEGDTREMLAGEADANGVSDSVHFAGFRSGLHTLLPQLDGVLLPSAWGEGAANAILEAAACALPVLASNIPGNDALVRDGETGRCLPPDDVSAWAEAMTALAASVERRETWGKAARKMIEEYYSIDQMVRRYADFYTELLNAGEKT